MLSQLGHILRPSPVNQPWGIYVEKAIQYNRTGLPRSRVLLMLSLTPTLCVEMMMEGGMFVGSCDRN